MTIDQQITDLIDEADRAESDAERLRKFAQEALHKANQLSIEDGQGLAGSVHLLVL